jgi:hypothetical protein
VAVAVVMQVVQMHRVVQVAVVQVFRQLAELLLLELQILVAVVVVVQTQEMAVPVDLEL